MNINPIVYPKLNSFNITILEIVGYKIYIEYVEPTFRAYINKKIYVIFNDIIYECIFGYENITEQKYYLTNNDLALLVTDQDTLIIYDTFNITKDNELITIQDIIDYFKSIGEGIFKLNTSNGKITETYSENSKSGLLSIFDKVKLDNNSFFIKTENIFIGNDIFYPVINLKSKPLNSPIPSNIYRIILNDSGNHVLDFTISFVNPEHVLIKINNCSFINNDNKIQFQFKKKTYTNGDVFISIEGKLIGSITNTYQLYVDIFDLNCLNLPIEIPDTTEDIFFNSSETSFIVDCNLLAINMLSKTTINNKNIQKFIAEPSQREYLIQNFSVSEDCLVFFNNVLQDVTIDGNVITLYFDPEGGEIIKVINVI